MIYAGTYMRLRTQQQEFVSTEGVMIVGVGLHAGLLRQLLPLPCFCGSLVLAAVFLTRLRLLPFGFSSLAF